LALAGFEPATLSL